MAISKHKGRWFAAAGLVVLIVVGAVAMGQRGNGGSDGHMPTVSVRRGSLKISVTESGTIKALDQCIIKSEVEGQTTIIFLVEEGTIVTEGQLLVQLDTSKLEDQKVDQEIRVQNAESAFICAREQLAVVKNQNTSDIAQATLDLDFAREDLTRYIDGEYPTQLMEAKNKLTLADEDLQRAADRVEGSKMLYGERYISATELKADELAHKRADLEKTLAAESLKLLEEHAHKRKLTELKAEIEQKDMATERVERKATADLVQAQADLNAKEAEFKRQQEKLSKLQDQLTKTEIHAPVAGMVVYASSAKGNWRGNAEPLDEGQSVRERQELIYLPMADSMLAEIKIHESSLDKVKPGLLVQVRVDAMPGLIFTGRVVRIAPLPDAQSMWLNPDLKVFSTHIHLDASNQALRTGMSCQATILVQQYDDVLYVPVQAVVRQGGQPVVYVVTGSKHQARPVTIGLDNNAMVHIAGGVESGELVMLAPPLSTSNVE